MNLLDLSTYFTLEPLVKRERKLFLEANDLYSWENLRYLMFMNYIIDTRGHCYDADIATLKKTEKGKLPLFTVRVSLYHMKNKGLVKYVRSEKLHPILKRRYLITEKGYKVIDNYLAMFSKHQKDVSYKLKKVHIDADKKK